MCDKKSADRKKLLSLLESVEHARRLYPDLYVDMLIANGVTFATDNNVGGKWIPVSGRLPGQFVSVLGYMTDAGDFPPVRECYVVGKAFYFPALCDVHPVSHWMPLPEPPADLRK